MSDPKISIDTPFARELGFTSDKNEKVSEKKRLST